MTRHEDLIGGVHASCSDTIRYSENDTIVSTTALRNVRMYLLNRLQNILTRFLVNLVRQNADEQILACIHDSRGYERIASLIPVFDHVTAGYLITCARKLLARLWRPPVLEQFECKHLESQLPSY